MACPRCPPVGCCHSLSHIIVCESLTCSQMLPRKANLRVRTDQNNRHGQEHADSISFYLTYTSTSHATMACQLDTRMGWGALSSTLPTLTCSKSWGNMVTVYNMQGLKCWEQLLVQGQLSWIFTCPYLSQTQILFCKLDRNLESDRILSPWSISFN